MFQISAYADRHVGRKRSNNEDFVTYFEPEKPEILQKSGRLYVLCDGVGGASFGEKASKFAAQSVLHDYYEQTDLEPGERLKVLVRKAGNQINQFANESDSFMRMATTLVAAVVLGDQLIVANVGDSRAYLVRDGKAQQITLDHSFVDEMVRSGQMTPDEAARSNAKNRITRSLGGERDVRVDIFRLQLMTGDRIVLCSDGLTRYAEPQDIFRLSQAGTPEAVVKNFIDFANRKGGVDNISVAFVAVDDLNAVETIPRKKGGVIPQSVDWDTLSTDPGSEKKQAKEGSITSVQWIVIAGLSFALLLVLGVLGWWMLFGRVDHGTEKQKETPVEVEQAVALTQTEVALLLGRSNTETNTPIPAYTQTQTPSPVPTETATLTPTEVPTITLTLSTETAGSEGDQQSNAARPDPQALISCLYTVESGETYFQIMDKLNPENTSDTRYQDRIICVYPLDCTFNPDDLNKISIGWELEFPDVPRLNCVQNDGLEIEPTEIPAN